MLLPRTFLLYALPALTAGLASGKTLYDDDPLFARAPEDDLPIPAPRTALNMASIVTNITGSGKIPTHPDLNFPRGVDHARLRSTIDSAIGAFRADSLLVNTEAVLNSVDLKKRGGILNRHRRGRRADLPPTGALNAAAPVPVANAGSKGAAAAAEPATPVNGKGAAAPAPDGTQSAPAAGNTKAPGFQDLAALVNPFIGTGATGNPGNVFPGASVPFGMAKVGIDLDLGYAPSGYNDDATLPVRGVSPLHDSGTGSSSGSYGNFETMPVLCKDGNYDLCPTTLDNRGRLRIAGKDYAEPGYFEATLDNGIRMEMTSTRRAGLQRYTFPASEMGKFNSEPFLVQDWTNDLPGTFSGGEMEFDVEKGQIRISGQWRSSFGVNKYRYPAHVCYDLLNDGKQKLGKTGLWAGDRYGQDRKALGATKAKLTQNTIGGQPLQTGALYSFSEYPKNGSDAVITIRFGLSFVSVDQACANAQLEVQDFNFERIVAKSRAKWNRLLNRITISKDTNGTIAEMLYTSLYRQFLTPNNATGEPVPPIQGASVPFYNSLYCTWDTYRTFYPFLSLHSPREYAHIVANFVDGWKQTGYLPECRANGVPGLTQGSSSGTSVIADFAVKYHDIAAKLGVNIQEIHDALVSDSFTTPEEWNSFGRQISVWRQYKYIPYTVFDQFSTGRQTREVSRGAEYAFSDFSVRQVMALVGDKENEAKLRESAGWYKNNFDPDVESFKFTNFAQQRFPNGTFRYVSPIYCSPLDQDPNHDCSLQQSNTYGIYEDSSWSYSLFAPHDTAGLIQTIANGDRDTFIRRIDTLFDRGLYYAGNEPAFQSPVAYHYANSPSRSVRRVRQVVFQNFGTTTRPDSGLPGNDDNGAMATLLLFHLCGFYPIPATREYLLLSPFLPQYTMRNEELGSFTVIVANFDKATLAENIPDGARAYIEKVEINGQVQSSRCKIRFEQLFPGGGVHTNITLTMTADGNSVDKCGESDADLPSSLSTGGFDKP